LYEYYICDTIIIKKEGGKMGTSEAQVKATMKYKARAYKRIPLDVRIEEYEALKEFTEKNGESINGFIRRIIKENIK